jgi:hypothetical protein
MLLPVAVYPSGPVQLYVVEPEADVLAVRVVVVRLQVSAPELVADMLTVIPEKAKTGFPIREENKMKDIMATLYLSRSNENSICIGFDDGVYVGS